MLKSHETERGAVLEIELDEFLYNGDAPLFEKFPGHCSHRLDSISLLTMGVPEHELTHLFQILGAQQTKDFYLRQLGTLKPGHFREIHNKAFIRSFMLWSTMKHLITTHLRHCDPLTKSDDGYIDGTFAADVFEDIPIKNMELSVRSKNVLQREGFMTASQLAPFEIEDLMKFQFMGESSVKEIEAQLLLLGVWGTEPKPERKPENQASYISSTNCSIDELGLSTRTVNGLKRHGYLDLARLLMSDDNDIRDIRNFGTMSIEEVRQIKARYSQSALNQNSPSPSTDISDSTIEIRNLMLVDIEEFASKLSEAGNVVINQKSLTHFHFSVSSRLVKYIENGNKTVLEVLEEVRTELSSKDAITKLELEIVFLARFQQAIEVYENWRTTIFPSKEITTSLYEYENRYSDDSVDILEFDDATYFYLDLDASKNKHPLEQETFFSFLDELGNSLICSPVHWNSLKAIIDFHSRFGTFPNFLGLTVASFAHEARNSEGAIQNFMEYLSHTREDNADRDFSIIQLRIQGSTLDKIGQVHSLTRERIRQILTKFSPHLNALTDLIHDERDNTKQAELSESVQQLFLDKGAIYKDELTSLLNMSFDDSYRILPKHFRKLIIDVTRESTVTSKWSREIVLEVLKKAGTYYFPLKISDYDHLLEIGEIEGPSVAKIGILFDSWGEACRMAGVEPAPALRHEYSKTWSDVELVTFVVRYLNDENTPGSFDGYRAWREIQLDHVPSEALLRNTFESWSKIKRQALEVIRIEKGHEVRP